MIIYDTIEQDGRRFSHAQSNIGYLIEDAQGRRYADAAWPLGDEREFTETRIPVDSEDGLPKPRVFNTADLVEALMEEGYWEAARAWVVEHGLLDLVLATKEFDETNANFVAGRAALQEALGLTDERIEELLARAAE